MGSFAARLEKSGRIVIPAAVCKALGLKQGAEVVVRIDEHGLCLMGTRQQALDRVQQRLRRFVDAGRLLSDELIAERCCGR
ncbi:MAG: AbrB/MazE/SpoVT family DNA-binding domain-containing protein [Acidobacteriota bacterium]